MSYPLVSNDKFENARIWAITNPRRVAVEVCKMTALLIDREWTDTRPREPITQMLEEQLHALHNEAAQVREENALLRQMLAFSYAGVHLYHDDGELQDNRVLPHIDFKRDPLPTIQYKMAERVKTAMLNAPNWSLEC